LIHPHRDDSLASSYGAFAPACFLDPSTHPQLQCHFAQPWDYQPHTELLNQTKDTTIKKGLRCSLGKDAMPYMCSSFPVGELVQTNPKKADTPLSSSSTPSSTPTSTHSSASSSTSSNKKRFYVLSNPNTCEGIGLGEQGTLGNYVQDNGLVAQSNERLWFDSIMSSFAERKFYLDTESIKSQIGEGTVEVAVSIDLERSLDLLFGISQALWYNFDTFNGCEDPSYVPLDHPLYEWKSVREKIDQKTNNLISIGSDYFTSMHRDVASHRNLFVELIENLKSVGVLDDSVV
jgi:hypothetical protein